MVSQEGRQRIRLPHNFTPHPLFAFRWPDSIIINLLIAGALGISYILLVLGPVPLEPTNLSWLDGDPATYYIGWELFRQDPHLRWPLTFTDRLGYPLGDSIAFMDPNPLLLVLLKPLSPLLPTPFQYLGIAAVLAASLQFFFAARLFRQLLGPNAFSVLLPTLFFLLAPPMTHRFHGHYALANHWLLIAALCLFVSLSKESGETLRRDIFFCALLSCVAVGVNAYLAFMVLIVVSAGVITAWWQRRLSLKEACAIFGATGVTCLFFALALGLMRSDGGYGGGGYRDFSMNLLAPIDPGVAGALFLRSLPHFSPLQYEGYNYLGAGILMLGVMLLPSFSRSRFRQFTVAEVVPLALGCLALTTLALSTKVTAGSVLIVDLDPHESLTKYLALFRASGRLFWMPYYVILTAILTASFIFWSPRKAVTLVTVALLVQFVDTLPLRASGVSSFQLPFHARQWSSLRKDHENLIVLPPWQCLVTQGADTPGGKDGFRIFGLLAVSQHMRTNSYYAARYSAASLEFHCKQAVRDLMNKPLSHDSAYVVSPSIARIIAAGPTGPNACRTLDDFILCSTKTDFGLEPDSPPEIPIIYASGRIESWLDAVERGHFIGDWYAPDPEGIWSKPDWIFGYSMLQFRLGSEQRKRYHAVALKLAVLVGTEGIRYRIQSGSHEQSGTVPGTAQARIEVFEVRIPLQNAPDGTERIVLITEDPVRPVDIGFTSDSRLFGLRVQGVMLVP